MDRTRELLRDGPQYRAACDFCHKKKTRCSRRDPVRGQGRRARRKAQVAGGNAASGHATSEASDVESEATTGSRRSSRIRASKQKAASGARSESVDSRRSNATSRSGASSRRGPATTPSAEPSEDEEEPVVQRSRTAGRHGELGAIVSLLTP